MVKALESILDKSNADRVILFKIEESGLLASGGSLFNIVPKRISSNRKAKKRICDFKVLRKKYPYHMFMSVIADLMRHGEAHYSVKGHSTYNDASNRYLKKSLKELKVEKFSIFKVNKNYFVSLQWCKDSVGSRIISRNLIEDDITYIIKYEL